MDRVSWSCLRESLFGTVDVATGGRGRHAPADWGAGARVSVASVGVLVSLGRGPGGGFGSLARSGRKVGKVAGKEDPPGLSAVAPAWDGPAQGESEKLEIISGSRVECGQLLP